MSFKEGLSYDDVLLVPQYSYISTRKDVDLSVNISKVLSDKTSVRISSNAATGAAAKRLWDAGADMVKVGIGGGCFASGTRVLMSDGSYKNIEHIVPGDRVINKDGKPVDVLDAFCTGVKEIATLKNNAFYKDTDVTLDHQFLLNDSAETEIDWKPISNLLSDDNYRILSPNKIYFESPESFDMIFSNHNKLKDDYETYSDKNPLVTINISPEYNLGYLAGSFLLVGVLRQNSVSFEFSNMDTLEASEVADKLMSVLDEVLGVSSFTYDINIIDDTMCMIIYNDVLLDILSAFQDEFGEKVFSRNFLANNKEYLQGIHDSYYENRFITIYGQPETKNQLFNEVFYFANQCLLGTFNNSFHNKSINEFNALSNASLHKSGECVLTYDITVDCPTHSFIADNMIVHNSRLETGNDIGIIKFHNLSSKAYCRA